MLVVVLAHHELIRRRQLREIEALAREIEDDGADILILKSTGLIAVAVIAALVRIRIVAAVGRLAAAIAERGLARPVVVAAVEG